MYTYTSRITYSTLRTTTMFEVIRDVSVYLAVMTTLLLCPTLAPRTTIVVSMPAIIAILWTARAHFDIRWVNWFEVGKLLGCIGAIVALSLMQSGIATYNRYTLFGLLMFNMGEAVLSDFLSHGRHGLPNALAGLAVMWAMPRTHDPHREFVSAESHVLHLSTSYPWILAYSIWNATFAYCFGYSRTTQLVLVPPIVLCWVLSNPTIWIVPRTWSMLVNMALRASQAYWVYKPGTLTKIPGDPGPSAANVAVAGSVSLSIILCILGMQTH